jgi:hypothetical protein
VERIATIAIFENLEGPVLNSAFSQWLTEAPGKNGVVRSLAAQVTLV